MDIKYDKNFYINVHKFTQECMKKLYKLRIYGITNIPNNSNYILAGNHIHILDSLLLLSYNDDNVRFMVDNKLYNNKIGEWFFKKVGTFGINPDSTDIKALKTALSLLKEGESIAIFPEGHTHDKDIDLEYKSGVAKISRASGVPIVPFGIYGSYKPFSTLILNIGEPINYKYADIPKDKIDKDLEIRIKSLIKK